jgi:hypothetical protein
MKPESIDWLKRDSWQSSKLNFEDFEKVLEKSKSHCSDLIKIKEQIFLLGTAYASFREIPNFFDDNRLISERYCQTLFFTCFLGSFRSVVGTLFLTAYGLYRNAYHNVRYALELLILSEQFDMAYPRGDFFKKLTLFKKQEEEDELRMLSLLKTSNHPCKGQMINEWRKLSKKVHPSYMQIIDTMVDFQTGYQAANIDDKEVNNIYKSLRNISHFYLVSLFIQFPEFREPLRNNKDFVAALRDHNQRLALKLLSSAGVHSKDV